MYVLIGFLYFRSHLCQYRTVQILHVLYLPFTSFFFSCDKIILLVYLRFLNLKNLPEVTAMTDIYFTKGHTDFTKTEQKIINYIIENPDSFVHMTIGEAARAIGSSEPTISRFARHCGYADFKELKTTVLRHLSGTDSPAGKLNSTIGSASSGTPEGFLQRQQFCIGKTLSFLEPKLMEQAVSAITEARTVYLYAKGAALSLAQLMHFRLTRFGIQTVLLPPGSSELFEYMNLFTEKDLVILFGFQKTPKEAQVLLDHQKERHYTCVFFTSRLYQPANDSRVIPLYVYRGEPTEYHSMSAPAALLDALVVMIGAKLGKRSEKYLDSLYQLKEHYKSEIPR